MEGDLSGVISAASKNKNLKHIKVCFHFLQRIIILLNDKLYYDL